MSHHRALYQSGLAVGLLVLVLAGSESLSYGGSSLPPTPCPCAADGVCRPVTPWGYSITRWRSWPGESIGQPTPPDAAVDSDEQGLRPYELPPPEREDLRGPAKDEAAKANKETADSAPSDGPAQLLPGPDALPAFDPQGNQLEIPGEIPGMDDAPPALPTSLRQAALAPPTSAPSALIMPQQARRSFLAATTGRPTVSSQPIRQAGWQQSHSIQLINPASAIVVESEAGSLQQAIYYEASDLGEKLAE